MPANTTDCCVRKHFFIYCFIFLLRKIPASISTGKMIAASIPAFRLSPIWLETNPASVGPEEQPRSPARARNANMAVPPPLMAAAALLKLPGQRIPTEKPHTAQPARLRTGNGAKDMQR